MTRRRLARLGAGVVLLALVAPAPAAHADPARPGNTRSVVTSVSAPGVISARVRGGDAFLELSVARGHEVTVLDYTGRPYLRFSADGTVDLNRRSTAAYLNRDRYATAGPPTGLDPAAEPDWDEVRRGGTYAWHDHRVHWMSPTVAPEQAWTVDVVVDGERGAVVGRFGPVAPPTGWPWWLLTAALLAMTLAAARRRLRLGALAAVIAAAPAVPVVVAIARLPASTWSATALVAATIVLAGVALAVGGRRPIAVACAGGAGVALALWGVRRTAVFDHAVLVTTLPGGLDRLAVAAALGGGAGLIAAVAWSALPAARPGAQARSRTAFK